MSLHYEFELFDKMRCQKWFALNLEYDMNI